MQQFRIKQDGFKEIKKQTLMRVAPIIFLAAAGGAAIASINSKDNESNVAILPIFIPLIVVSVGIGLYRGLNRQKALFESFVLTIADNLITREQLNTPTVSIYFNDIQLIKKNKNGSFII